ncbi:uncharacterized protein B0T15DRAFT_211246 [Chaetomium strumarium]|uniref:Uncharacterized protein n=1 Tax=Chaetomium strumarium TaxID=1170767 RepID=A0AAJ0M1T8_9PEZI|nr:hypothetical protein B0T15DRAFT_211246 [Chaetomium strumarium]
MFLQRTTGRFEVLYQVVWLPFRTLTVIFGQKSYDCLNFRSLRLLGVLLLSPWLVCWYAAGFQRFAERDYLIKVKRSGCPLFLSIAAHGLNSKLYGHGKDTDGQESWEQLIVSAPSPSSCQLSTPLVRYHTTPVRGDKFFALKAGRTGTLDV